MRRQHGTGAGSIRQACAVGLTLANTCDRCRRHVSARSGLAAPEPEYAIWPAGATLATMTGVVTLRGKNRRVAYGCCAGGALALGNRREQARDRIYRQEGAPAKRAGWRCGSSARGKSSRPKVNLPAMHG